MSTELTPIERARGVLQFDETKARLADLAARSVRIVEITGAPGYKEAHQARIDLKNARIAVEKTGKEAREDATAYSKAVIAAEKELVGVIQPEESRLQALQDDFDAKAEAARQAKIKAEQDRVAALYLRVAGIREAHIPFAGKSGDVIRAGYLQLRVLEIGDDFQEFQPAAEAARAEALAKLEAMGSEAEQHEAAEAQRQQEEAERAEALRIESERLAAERAELERLRAEQAERDRIEREAREAETAKERAEIERQRAELRSQQEAATKAQADAEATQRAAEDAQRRAEEDARQADLDRQYEADRAAIEAAEAKARAAREAATVAEATRIAAEIDSATLREAAQEAVGLLTELGEGEHITTRKLAAAQAREPRPMKELPPGVLPWEPVNSQGCYYTPNGTLMNADRTRSIFDDVDQGGEDPAALAREGGE